MSVGEPAPPPPAFGWRHLSRPVRALQASRRAAPLWFPVPAERTGRGPFPPPAGNGVVESMVWPPAGNHRYQDGVVLPEMYDIFVQTVASTATTRHSIDSAEHEFDAISDDQSHARKPSR